MRHAHPFLLTSVPLLVLASAFGMLAGMAQEPGVSIPNFRFTFEDGSIITARPKQGAIEVSTELGKIKIPFSKLAALELGPKLSVTESAVFKEVLDKLGSDDHTEREAANEKLNKLGMRFYHKLDIEVKDMEVKKRLIITKGLYEREYGKQFLKEAKPDFFRTATVSGQGLLIDKTIKAESKHLGVFDIDVSVLVSAQSLGNIGDKQIEVAGTQEDWLDTKIDLLGNNVRLISTGMLDLYVQQPGQYMCDADGYQKETNTSALTRSGALLYKTGDEVTPHFAGVSARTNSKGRLYLKIQKNPWNVKTVGSYKVKITAE